MTKKLILLVVGILVSFSMMQAQTWNQIGEDIDGEAAYNYSGISNDISSDGSVVAIGAYGNTANGSYTGHVRVYENQSGTWIQIGNDIDGDNEFDQLGVSLSLSANGSIVAVGAFGHDGNGNDDGLVRVFENQDGTWTQIGADINGEAAGDYSGIAVSLSADGSVVAIGADENFNVNGYSGHVRVYENVAGTWTQIGDDIDGEAQGDKSGFILDLSPNGSIVAIGAPKNDGNGISSGQVRIYENLSGTWVQIGDDLDGEAADDRFGSAISLSSDGTFVAIGGPRNDGNGNEAGHVRIYENIAGTWTQFGDDVDGEAAEDRSGISASLSLDGSILAIGAYLNDGNGTDGGHVRIYQIISGTWTQMGDDIHGEAADDRFGYSVSLNSDNSIIAIGAYGNDGNGADAGHVRVLSNNPTISINEVSFNTISVFPNPTNGIFTIDFPNLVQSNIKITDIVGKIIFKNQYSIDNKQIIDISNHPTGIYYIKIMDENGNFETKKVVKK